jgi:hypothetical protein
MFWGTAADHISALEHYISLAVQMCDSFICGRAFFILLFKRKLPTGWKPYPPEGSGVTVFDGGLLAGRVCSPGPWPL